MYRARIAGKAALPSPALHQAAVVTSASTSGALGPSVTIIGVGRRR